jgi:pyridoxal 5'-phosphate synthase pdxS subunit
MIRTKREACTGDVIEAVRHQRMMTSAFSKIAVMDDLQSLARRITEEYRIDDGTGFEGLEEGFPNSTEEVLKILEEIKEKRRLPVVNFAAGGIATPADAVLMMTLGSDGVFVGSGIFKSEEPESTAKAIVEAVAHFDDPKALREAQKASGKAMKGTEAGKLEERLQMR